MKTLEVWPSEAHPDVRWGAAIGTTVLQVHRMHLHAGCAPAVPELRRQEGVRSVSGRFGRSTAHAPRHAFNVEQQEARLCTNPAAFGLYGPAPLAQHSSCGWEMYWERPAACRAWSAPVLEVRCRQGRGSEVEEADAVGCGVRLHRRPLYGCAQRRNPPAAGPDQQQVAGVLQAAQQPHIAVEQRGKPAGSTQRFRSKTQWPDRRG